MDLSRNLLTGSLPASLRSLTRLSSFRLRDNYLFGSGFVFSPLLPDSLLELDLSLNFLTGTLQEEIWILSSLETLNLRRNSFTGAIPEGILPGNHLSTLDLSENSWTGSIPFDFGQLTNLISLDLSDIRLSGLSLPTTWEFLSSMTKLESLDLSRNYIGFFQRKLRI